MGETLTITYTQTHADTEPVENTASVTDRGDPDNNVASDVVDPAAPSLDLVKAASPNQITAAGETIEYSFAVTNTGNIALFDISIEEGSFSGTGSLGEADCPAGPDGLLPADTVVCTVDYVATQADVDSGEVTNTAVAQGTTPGGSTAESAPSSAVVEALQAPGLALEKAADVERVSVPGQLVTYTFTVTNTGNVTVTDLSVSEGTFSGAGDLSAIACPEVALAPGESADCTATYVVVAADLEAGQLSNTATASGLDPGGDGVESNPSTATVEARAVAPTLPRTGPAVPAATVGGVALLLLVTGGTLVLSSRRSARPGSS